MSFLHDLPESLIKVVSVIGIVQLEREYVTLRGVKERLSIASDPTNLSRIANVGLDLTVKMRNCFYRSRGHLRTAGKRVEWR